MSLHYLPRYVSPQNSFRPASLLRVCLSMLLTKGQTCVRSYRYTDLNVSPSKPGQPTGWTLDPNGGEHSFQVPEAWNGRIWGRRDCNFDGSGLPSTCVTGGCSTFCHFAWCTSVALFILSLVGSSTLLLAADGGYYCDQEGGTGVPPTTVAEFTVSPAWYTTALTQVESSAEPFFFSAFPQLNGGA